MNDIIPERWQQIDALFADALERPPDERTAFLRHACCHDRSAHNEVVALIEGVEEAAHVLGESITAFSAMLMPDVRLICVRPVW